MPCRCDYMEPSQREIEASKVMTLLDELDGKPFDHRHFTGYHPHAYNSGITQKGLDLITASLCHRLRKSKTKVAARSLELQMWWRDHQAGEARRAAEDAKAAEVKRLRKQALAKLTIAERKALGL